MLQAEWFNLRREDHLNKYYPIVADWWEGRKWSAVHPMNLSSNGMIIKYNNEYICAAWLYVTDSNIGIINWFITNNQKNQGKIKKKALSYLLIKLEELAKKLEIGLIYNLTETKSIAKIIHQQGFTQTSNKINEFFKKI